MTLFDDPIAAPCWPCITSCPPGGIGNPDVVDTDADLPRPVADLTARAAVDTEAVTALLPHFERFDRDHEFDFSVRTLVRGLAAAPAVETVPRYWFNSAAVSRHFIVPGSIAIIMTIIGLTSVRTPEAGRCRGCRRP